MSYKKNIGFYQKTTYIVALIFVLFLIYLFAGCSNTISNGLERDDNIEISDQCTVPEDFYMELEPVDVTETAPKINCFAPGFSLKDLEGDDWKLEDNGDQALIVIFWNTGCNQCFGDLTLLEELQAFEDRIQVVAVNVLEEQSAVQEYIQEKGFTFQILLDSQGEVYKEYLLESFPVTVAINSRGVITFIQNGPMNTDNLEMLRRSALDLMELYPTIK